MIRQLLVGGVVSVINIAVHAVVMTILVTLARTDGTTTTSYHHPAPAEANRTYFAFGNYTTLGYGDILPVARWRMLGPITALNGVLLIGWSTAVIFEVLRRALLRTEIPR